VISDLCVMKPDPEDRELTVVSLHPGVTREQVQEATGWDIRFAAELETTPVPSAHELEVLRELKARTDRAHSGQ
jgi:glutaconate CoA-transferase subunit B